MKARSFALSVLALLLLIAPSAFSQFTAEEIAQRAQWEEFLQTAEITRWEEVGRGVNKPLRLYMKKGDLESRACWKNPHGVRDGFLEGWQYEIAAYRLDKLIGLNMIPPAVEREFNGKKGALVYWLTDVKLLLEIIDEKIKMPVLPQIDDMKYITRAWDCLIANEDRTQENIFYTKDWRTLLIDHSRSFRSTKEFTQKLMFGKNGLKASEQGRPFLFRRLPRWFVEKVKGLDFKSINEAVGPYLEDKEIEAIIKRKALLLAEIDEMIKESGEDKVLY